MANRAELFEGKSIACCRNLTNWSYQAYNDDDDNNLKYRVAVTLLSRKLLSKHVFNERAFVPTIIRRTI